VKKIFEKKEKKSFSHWSSLEIAKKNSRSKEEEAKVFLNYMDEETLDSSLWNSLVLKKLEVKRSPNRVAAQINKKALEFYSTQLIDEKDIESVLEVLYSESLSRGPKIEEFEKEIGAFCKNSHVLALNSATSALQLAYQVLRIRKDSLVWTSPITFVATTNAALHFGAKIDFVDIDPNTLNICPILLEKKLIRAKEKASKLPDFVTVVHFGGSPCDMQKIYQLSEKYKFKIIEDASHAFGATIQNTKIGENRYSHASVFSFHPVKMITTGEGGALLLSSKEDYAEAKSLRSHGISRKYKTSRKGKPDWYYEQEKLGYNFRMSELQAALGITQLKKNSILC
jgi:dTDP-4-amino-4,6-dideoxygalactose transaminase